MRISFLANYKHICIQSPKNSFLEEKKNKDAHTTHRDRKGGPAIRPPAK